METRKSAKPKPDSASDEDIPPPIRKIAATPSPTTPLKVIAPAKPVATQLPSPVSTPAVRPTTLTLPRAPMNTSFQDTANNSVSETILADLLTRVDDLSTTVATLRINSSPETKPLFKSVYNKFMPSKIAPKFVEESLEQLESWLKLNDITGDDEKFHLLKMLVEPETYQQVGAIITSPPETDKYDTLRKAIILAFTESEAHRLKALLGGVQLGNRRPTQLLSEMSLLYKGPKDKLFVELFMGRLPPTVRAILVSMQKNQPSFSQPPSIDMLAQWADAIIEQTEPQSSINQIISDPPQEASLMSTLSGLINKIDTYTARRSKPPFRPKGKRTDDICWYHRKHGQNKHLNQKCDPDCRLRSAWEKVQAAKLKND